jgi:hypothetical protein
MSSDGSIVFGELVGKLNVLRVECAKCGRAGRYSVARPIEQHGADGQDDRLAPGRRLPEAAQPRHVGPVRAPAARTCHGYCEPDGYAYPCGMGGGCPLLRVRAGAGGPHFSSARTGLTAKQMRRNCVSGRTAN